MDLDRLIQRCRHLYAGAGLPWVLFQHGTCVTLADSGGDMCAQAVELIEGLRSRPRADRGESSIELCADRRGWFVGGDHPDVRTYVEGIASAAGEGGGGTVAATIGLWGRSRLDLDIDEGGIVHVEDPRPDRDEISIRRADAWARLVRKAEQAEGEGSDWGRFSVPVAAVKLLDEGDESRPPALADLELSPDVRETSEVLEDLIRDTPPPLRNFTLFTGLRAGDGVDADVLTAAILARRFPRDRVVALTGFISAAGRTEPPLYAAKPRGAMLAVKVCHAAPLDKPGNGPDEYEFLLPRDCRCRVIDVLEEGLFPDGSGRPGRSTRVTLRLEQLPTVPDDR